MLKIIFAFFISLSEICLAQYAGQSVPCIWSGGVANCLPTDGLLLSNQKDIRLGEAVANGSQYVALQAPASVAGNVTLTLPDALGSNLQFLQTDASGVLSWSPALINPMTTEGDIILGGASGAATRLGVGAANQILQRSGATLAWGAGLATTSVPGLVSIGGQTFAGTKKFDSATTLGPTSSGGTSNSPVSHEVFGMIGQNTADGVPIYLLDSRKKHTDTDVAVDFWRLNFTHTQGLVIVKISGGQVRHNNTNTRIFAWYSVLNTSGTVTVTDLGAGTTNLVVSNVTATTGSSLVTFSVNASGGASRRAMYVSIEVSGGGDAAGSGGSPAQTFSLTRL